MKSNVFSFYVPILLTVIGLLFVFPPQIEAASSYTVSPLVIDHEVEKRDIISETITITNKGTNLLRVYPTVNEVSVNEGGELYTFIDSTLVDRSDTITSWIEISRGRLEIKPGESKQIPLTIRMNPNVVSGEYHAFIGFAEGSNRPEAEQKVMNGQVAGTVVRLEVDKVQNQFLRLEKFIVDRFITKQTENPINFTLINPGQDPVVPSGEIIIYDNNGAEVGAIPVNPEGIEVAPEEEVSITSKIPDDLKMGKFKAFLSVEYGNNFTASIHDTAFFYVLPLKQLIIVFSIVLILAILIALYIHRRYDGGTYDDDGTDEVAMFIRKERSEEKEHDIDLSKKS